MSYNYFFLEYLNINENASIDKSLICDGFNKNKELFHGISLEDIQKRGYVWFSDAWRSGECIIFPVDGDIRCEVCQNIVNQNNHYKWIYKKLEESTSQNKSDTQENRFYENTIVPAVECNEELMFTQSKETNQKYTIIIISILYVYY